jgi:hypothetical protein
MKWALVAIVAGLLVMVRLVVWRRRQRLLFGDTVTPAWLNEHVYRRDGDRL